MFPESEISPAGFTCTASSSLSKEDLHSLNGRLDYTPKCENVYTSSKYGWFTNWTGEGSWIKLEFNAMIRISKIIYRHNERLPYKCCNQNFKDISIHFSDGAIANATVDDVFESDVDLKSIDFHHQIDPPKLSSNLRILVNSVYNHTRAAVGFENGGNPFYDKSPFGLSSFRYIG